MCSYGRSESHCYCHIPALSAHIVGTLSVEDFDMSSRPGWHLTGGGTEHTHTKRQKDVFSIAYLHVMFSFYNVTEVGTSKEPVLTI